MNTQIGEYVVRPIGYVLANESDPPGSASETRIVEILPGFARGLEGIEQFETIWVVYWLHQLPEETRSVLLVHPGGDRTAPLRGVFSTHSPMRPNPIGLSRARLLRRENNLLYLSHLDALPGSPILDIKAGE